MGGAGHKMAHNVFVWDKSFGSLVKVLEGPRESLIHCDVSVGLLRLHPHRLYLSRLVLSEHGVCGSVCAEEKWRNADDSGIPLDPSLRRLLHPEMSIYGKSAHLTTGPRSRPGSRN